MVEQTKIEVSVDTLITSFQLDINGITVVVVCDCLDQPQHWDVSIMDENITLQQLQVVATEVSKFVLKISSTVFEINNFEETTHVPKSTSEFCQ